MLVEGNPTPRMRDEIEKKHKGQQVEYRKLSIGS
jgi:hypothetical protein